MKANLYITKGGYPDRWCWTIIPIDNSECADAGLSTAYGSEQSARSAARRWARDHHVEIVEEWVEAMDDQEHKVWHIVTCAINHFKPKQAPDVSGVPVELQGRERGWRLPGWIVSTPCGRPGATYLYRWHEIETGRVWLLHGDGRQEYGMGDDEVQPGWPAEPEQAGGADA
jgi:hypothetical protein